MKLIMVIAIVITTLLYIGSICLIYVNRHEEKIAQIGIVILVLAIVNSFILVVFQIHSPLPSDSKTIDVLILRNNENSNITEISQRLMKVGSSHRTGCEFLSNVHLMFPKNEDAKSDRSDVLGLDVVEMALWSWLSSRYALHWDVNIRQFEAISGGQRNVDISPDAEQNPSMFSPDQLEALLQDSTYRVDRGQFWEMSLPSGSSVKIIKRSPYTRIFQIKNKHIDFTIKIYTIGGSGLLFTTLGENIRKTLQSPDSWHSDNIKVEFECRYVKWFRGSLSTKKQKKWVNEIMNDFYNDFEWSLVKPDLERAYSNNN